MSLLLPLTTSPLNSPDHSFLHRVIAVDSEAQEQSIKVKNGLISFSTNKVLIGSDEEDDAQNIFEVNGRTYFYSDTDSVVFRVKPAGADIGVYFGNGGLYSGNEVGLYGDNDAAIAVYDCDTNIAHFGFFASDYTNLFNFIPDNTPLVIGSSTLSDPTNILEVTGNSLFKDGNVNLYNSDDVAVSELNFYFANTLRYYIHADNDNGYMDIGMSSADIAFSNLTTNKKGIFSFSNIDTSDKTFTFPNKSGTIALTSDLPSVHNHQDTAGGGTLAETALALTDVTTNDVSTTKHGFAPKAPNDTTKFLRGDGTWAAPSGGSPIVFSSGNLGSISANTVTSVTHNLGISQADWESGRYLVTVVMQDQGSYYGNVCSGVLGRSYYKTYRWSSADGDTTNDVCTAQANTLKIKLDTTTNITRVIITKVY